MSIILSALHEAEKSRKLNRRSSPDLFAQVDVVRMANLHKQSPVGVYGRWAFLVATGFFAVYLLTDIQYTGAVRGAQPLDAPVFTPLHIQRLGDAEVPPADHDPLAVPEDIRIAMSEVYPSVPPQAVLYLDQLPPAMRATLPQFDFNGHFYSERNPQSARVIINNRSLKSGDFIDSEFKVREIDALGVSLLYRDLAFRVDKSYIFR